MGGAVDRNRRQRRWKAWRGSWQAGGGGELFAGWLSSRQAQTALPKGKKGDTPLLEDEREPAAKRLPDRSHSD